MACPLPVGLREQCQIIRPEELCPKGLPGGQALPHLGDAGLALPLFGERPAPQERCLCEHERKAVFLSEPHFRLGPLLGGLDFPTELMQHGSVS